MGKKKQPHNRKQALKVAKKTVGVTQALNNSMPTERGAVYFCETPRVLKRLELNPLPIFMPRNKFNNAMAPEDTFHEPHTHGISEETMRKLPQLLADPLCVYGSYRDKKLSLVLVLEDATEDNRPIIAVIQPNQHTIYDLKDGAHQIKTNLVKTMYPLNRAQKILSEALAQGMLMYINPEIRQKDVFLRRVQLQLLQSEYSRPLQTVSQIEAAHARAHKVNHEVKHKKHKIQAEALKRNPPQEIPSLADAMNEKIEVSKMMNTHPFEDVRIRGDPEMSNEDRANKSS